MPNRGIVRATRSRDRRSNRRLSGALHHDIWTTTPRISRMAYCTHQMRTFYEGSPRVGFDFTSGPIPDSPFGFVRRTAET